MHHSVLSFGGQTSNNEFSVENNPSIQEDYGGSRVAQEPNRSDEGSQMKIEHQTPTKVRAFDHRKPDLTRSTISTSAQIWMS